MKAKPNATKVQNPPNPPNPPNEGDFKKRLIAVVDRSITAFEEIRGEEFFETGRIVGLEKLIKIQSYIDLWASPENEEAKKSIQELERMFGE